MSKSARTYELEEVITLATARPNRIGCSEVGLDDFGIVDYISMDLNGSRTIRCYELKISKSDFLSDSKKTFIGDFNYYVLPTELYLEVKNYVEPGVGIWLVDKKGRIECKKQATKQTCQMDRKRVMGKILRALNRENLKHVENAWRDRQINKRVVDSSGAELKVGDRVLYHGKEYELIAIEYERDDTSMNVICVVINQVGSEHKLKPSIVKKVQMRDIISAAN